MATVQQEANRYPDEIAQLGALILSDHTRDAVLEKIVDIAEATIQAASSVSVTLVQRGEYCTTHASAEEAVMLDEAQYAAGAGPCIDAIKSGERITSASDADIDVWKDFCERANELGVRGTMSTPLLAGENSYGALTCYTREPSDFGEDDIAVAQALADQASVVVANATALMEASILNEQLRDALASREVIGEAKGILIEREGCSRDEAFDILRRASQRENRKIREIAEEIVKRAERGMSAT